MSWRIKIKEFWRILSNNPLVLVGVAFTALVSENFVADILNGDDIFKWLVAQEWQPAAKVSLIAVCVLSIAWVYERRACLFPRFDIKMTEGDVKPHAALIYLLSTMSPKPNGFEFPLVFNNISMTDCNDALVKVDVTLKGDNLKEDIEKLNPVRWNWQQLLRAIEPHSDTLRYVYLIGSCGAGGSYLEIKCAKVLIEKYTRSIVLFDNDTKDGVDFEDVAAVMSAIRKAVKRLQLCLSTPTALDDILIDITPGQKPTSIAGAMMTINNGFKFQYVQTGAKYKVKQYDLRQRLDSRE